MRMTRLMFATLLLVVVASACGTEDWLSIAGPSDPAQTTDVLIVEETGGTPEPSGGSFTGTFGLSAHGWALEIYKAGPGLSEPPVLLGSADMAGRYWFELAPGAYRQCYAPAPYVDDAFNVTEFPSVCFDFEIEEGEALHRDLCSDPTVLGPAELSRTWCEGEQISPAPVLACPSNANVCFRVRAEYAHLPELDGSLYQRVWPLDANSDRGLALVPSDDGLFSGQLSPGRYDLCFLEQRGGPFSCAVVDVSDEAPVVLDICWGDCERWTGENILEVRDRDGV